MFTRATFLKESSPFADAGNVKGTSIVKLIATTAAFALVGGLFAPPANAGTLTSTSFTTNGSGYAITNAKNARYDWKFSSATTSTVSNVKLTVPSGTTYAGSRYLSLSNSSGDYATSPDSTANSVTGDIDLRGLIAPSSWTPSVEQPIVTKWNGGAYLGEQYGFSLGPSGALKFFWSFNGSNANAIVSTSPVSFAAQSKGWVRASVQQVDMSTRTATFYTSSNGTDWAQLGTPASATASNRGPIYDGTTAMQIGNQDGGTKTVNEGIYYADVRNTLSGATSSSTCNSAAVVVCFNPSDYVSGTAFASSSSQAEQWTIVRSAAPLPADIVYALNVAEVSGLPSTGTGSYRIIDGFVNYLLLTPISVNAGTPCLIALSGFNSTPNAGLYTSSITSLNSGSTVDSAVTGSLTFADLASSAIVGTTVDPTFSFTVATHAGACNTFAQTAGVSSSATGVTLSRVNASAGAVAAQDLSVETNANTGFNLLFRSSGPLTSGANTIADAPGTNVSPAAFPTTTTAAFGYSVSGLSRFNNAWAGASTNNKQIATGASVGTVTNCIAYKVQVTANTPAGTYATTAIYTAVPSF